jgi:hypothetical protein
MDRSQGGCRWEYTPGTATKDGGAGEPAVNFPLAVISGDDDKSVTYTSTLVLERTMLSKPRTRPAAPEEAYGATRDQ